ncbi:MAG: hypothetical protein EOS07_35175 [Mesorhizobium sp.]|nr:MAG: hypothetical protein EOS07_35175 [Mesorhizobium sp.]
MLDHFLTKVFGKTSRKAVLAKYRLNVGMLEPSYERLQELEIVRDVDIEGLPANLDVWNFQFESYAFRLVMNPNIHVLDPDPFGRGRLVAAFIRKAGEENFTPLNDRVWFRQLDGLREMMPELDSLFPPRA